MDIPSRKFSPHPAGRHHRGKERQDDQTGIARLMLAQGINRHGQTRPSLPQLGRHLLHRIPRNEVARTRPSFGGTPDKDHGQSASGLHKLLAKLTIAKLGARPAPQR